MKDNYEIEENEVRVVGGDYNSGKKNTPLRVIIAVVVILAVAATILLIVLERKTMPLKEIVAMSYPVIKSKSKRPYQICKCCVMDTSDEDIVFDFDVTLHFIQLTDNVPALVSFDCTTNGGNPCSNYNENKSITNFVMEFHPYRC